MKFDVNLEIIIYVFKKTKTTRISSIILIFIDLFLYLFFGSISKTFWLNILFFLIKNLSGDFSHRVFLFAYCTFEMRLITDYNMIDLLLISKNRCEN